ncbi:hypothetical protein G7054_g8473 [Neopestalotiopsis clavispora]|nr:hypothetical protein G7054_g8473 [Neopestalotiopsis clavispora]
MSQVERPLVGKQGCIEKYSTIRSHLGIYLNVCLTAKYRRSHQRNASSLRPDLYAALASVVSCHPALALVPVDMHTNEPRFHRLSHIDLDRAVTFRRCDGGEVELDALLTTQHNLPFQEDELETSVPFWRLVVVESTSDRTCFHVIFCFHHAIGDTKSAVVFHQDLEQALCMSRESNSPTPRMIPTSTAPLPPILESVFPLPVPSPAKLQNFLKPAAPPADLWSGREQFWPAQTRFVSRIFSPETTAGLRRVCQREQTSITAALMSLAAATLFRILPTEYTVLQGDCAISLRRYVDDAIVSDSDMGCWVGTCSHVYRRGESSLWEGGRGTKDTIQAAIARGVEDMPVACLAYVPDMLAWFQDKMGGRRWAAFEISNVGTVGSTTTLKDNGTGYEMETVLFSQSASACAGAIKISVATGRDGRLAVGFTWQMDAVETSTATEFVKAFAQLLIESSKT